MAKFSCVILAVATVVNIYGLSGAQEECSLGIKTLDVTAASQYLTSPNYPGKYPDDWECTRRLSAPIGSKIIVFILQMDLEDSFGCRRDYVEFSEDVNTIATMCKETVPSVISSGNIMKLKFKTDVSVSGRGFRLEYRILRDSDWQMSDCPPEGSPALQATDGESTLQSPGYPRPYRNDLNCYWVLETQDSNKVIQITVVDSTLESSCEYDSVSAYEGRRRATGQKIVQWCGSDKPNFHSSVNTMLLHFHTDGSSTFKGFSLRYRQVSRDEAVNSPGFCPRTPHAIAANNDYRELISPNYPNGYSSNLNCVWLLRASDGLVVELAVRDSVLESSCGYDHVTVRDGDSEYSNVLGTFCGTDAPTYYSTGRYLIVQFQTDGSGQYKGFRMEYRQLSPDDVPRGAGLEVILPSVFGSIAAVVLCCCCCKYCCCNDKEDAAPSAAATGAAAAAYTVQASPHATYTHPTVTWTPGGTTIAGSEGTPYPGQPNMYAGPPSYPAQTTYPPPPQQPPLDGYSATNGSNPPPSGYSALPGARPPSPYYSGHQSDVEGGRASPLMPSAPPPPPSAPSVRVMEEPPPSYDSLRFDDVTGAPLLSSPAHGGADGGEESNLLYERKC